MNMDSQARGLLKYWLVCFLGTACLIGSSVVFASTGQEQRDLFLQAERALKNKQLKLFDQLRQELKDYPLLVYLDLQKLQKQLSRTNKAEIAAFLQNHKGEPVADILRRQWLDLLAKKKRWKDYLRFYTPQLSIRRQCNRLRALIETGATNKAWPLVEKIWLHGDSRPPACDPVFASWEAAGKRSDTLTWKRISLAMKAGNWRLARYLGKKLGKSDRIWVARWIKIHRNPESLLRLKGFTQPHPYREIMLGDAVHRLARINGMKALALWRSLKNRYHFSKPQIVATERRIALALERDTSPEAYAFINELTPANRDTRLHLACFRAALLHKDWPRIIRRLEAWPDAEKKTDRWQYWYARALDETGQKKRARIFYKKAAANRSYYGFLAADRIDAPYHLLHRKTPENKFARARLERLPGVKRALELHALDRDVKARREWYYVTRELKKPELRAAALIARENGWLDQAIFTMAKANEWDDLKLRFPLRYQNLVANEARSNTLDMAWIYAVIRQESAFMRDARSHTGAVGLMQLMPSTARKVATKLLKRKPPAHSEILEPALNIALGSAYLRQLKQRLNNNTVLATAAYNAGPYRVIKWLPSGDLPADIWIELVPFKETHRYLKRVLSYMVIYDKRLGRQPKRLKERMLPVITLQKGARVTGI